MLEGKLEDSDFYFKGYEKFAFPNPNAKYDDDGINRIEYYAVHCMQGLLAAGNSYDPKELASNAVDYAKALLEQIDLYGGFCLSKMKGVHD